MAESLSLEYITRLSMAKEDTTDIKSAVYIRNMNMIEGQQRLLGNISRMEWKSKGGSTSQVIIANLDEVTTEYIGKGYIEKMITKGNDQSH